jgi:hypothetical protein
VFDRILKIARVAARRAAAATAGRATAVVVLAAAAGLAACDGTGSSDLSGPDLSSGSSLTVRMTDAPGDLEAAWVRVTEIRLPGESDADGGGTILEVEDPEALIPLTPEAVTDLISDEPVEPGVYGQLRLVIDGGVAESTDGRVWTFGGAEHPDGLEADGRLKCPSCGQTGVKVNLPGGALELEDEAVVLMLDFNVSESFGHVAGRSGKFILRPTITSSVVETSGDVRGSVVVGDGVSLPECGGEARSVEDFTPRAVRADDPETSVTAEVEAENEEGTEGSYSMRYLQPGDWDMTFIAEKEFEVDGGTETLTFEATADPGRVTVESGVPTTADYTVTGADCAGPDGGSEGGDDSGS